MRKLLLLLLKCQSRFPYSRWILLLMLTVGFTTGWKCAQAGTTQQHIIQAQAGKPVPSNATQTAPAELKNLLTQIDAAASRGDIKTVMSFYSPTFKHGDGLNRQTMEQALTNFWKQYPNLKYTTQLQSWQNQGGVIVANTVTQIIGVPAAGGNNAAMSATITSRQQVAGGKIVRQDVLAERTQITSGTQPPKVDFKLPQQVKIGQQYSLDAIIKEPLGDEYILGAALEEPVKPDKYLAPTPVNLELLSSGGIFKIGTAPKTPGAEWLSAVILRGNGMTMITQRLQVVK